MIIEQSKQVATSCQGVAESVVDPSTNAGSRSGRRPLPPVERQADTTPQPIALFQQGEIGWLASEAELLSLRPGGTAAVDGALRWHEGVHRAVDTFGRIARHPRLLARLGAVLDGDPVIRRSRLARLAGVHRRASDAADARGDVTVLVALGWPGDGPAVLMVDGAAVALDVGQAIILGGPAVWVLPAGAGEAAGGGASGLALLELTYEAVPVDEPKREPRLADDCLWPTAHWVAG
jgi:hypothetical protein